MKDEMTLREFKTRYEAGEFAAPDFQTQVRAGQQPCRAVEEAVDGHQGRHG